MIVSSDLIELPLQADYICRDIRIHNHGEFRLHRVRIYERIPVFPDDPLEVLRDALLARKRKSEVDEIISDTGIAGMWAPSTVLLRRIHHWGSSMNLTSGGATIAHTLWDHDFNVGVVGGDGFSFEFWNDCHFERQIRVSLILRDAAQGPGSRIRP